MKNRHYTEVAEEMRSNDQQWKAYESEGNCVILAGPGSGKTKTITTKIARLLSEEISSPRKLACLTYSNACVTELRHRLQNLGVADSNKLVVATVHSFCLTELVIPFGKLAGIQIPNPMAIASPADAARFFKNACVELLRAAQSKTFRTNCDRIRRTIPDKNGIEWRSANSRNTSVIERFEALLAENNMMDFDGLVLTGLELIRKQPWIREAICAKFPVIVIDEYQDLGVPLHQMVLNLMDAGVRIVAVGDPDQSIYGFTGARPALLKTFKNVAGVEVISLKLNYRCADQIIAASKVLLPEPSEFESHDGRQGLLKVYRIQKPIKGQANYALSVIVPKILSENPNWKHGDIAILYRTMNEGNAVAEAADDLGLSYFRLDNGSPIKRSRLIEWLTELAKWSAGGWKTGSVSLGGLLKVWRSMRRSLTRDSDILKARTRIISTIFEHRDPNEALGDWLLAIKEGFLDELVEEPDLSDEKDNLAELLANTWAEGPLESFTVDIFGSRGKSPDQINFMTLHSSKGLEFEAVFIVGLEDGVFPNNMDTDSDDQLEEATRLFYVGLTRAKNQIHLLHAHTESQFITKIRTGAEISDEHLAQPQRGL